MSWIVRKSCGICPFWFWLCQVRYSFRHNFATGLFVDCSQIGRTSRGKPEVGTAEQFVGHLTADLLNVLLDHGLISLALKHTDVCGFEHSNDKRAMGREEKLNFGKLLRQLLDKQTLPAWMQKKIDLIDDNNAANIGKSHFRFLLIFLRRDGKGYLYQEIPYPCDKALIAVRKSRKRVRDTIGMEKRILVYICTSSEINSVRQKSVQNIFCFVQSMATIQLVKADGEWNQCNILFEDTGYPMIAKITTALRITFRFGGAPIGAICSQKEGG